MQHEQTYIQQGRQTEGNAHLLELAGERVERLKLADVATEGREQRVITPLITVVYYSQTLQPFKWRGKHLVGRLRAAGWCTLISDEAEYSET